MHDEFSTRMKMYYEKISDDRLMRRCPVVLRLDGVAFHTFTRKFDKPFDAILMKTMQETMKYLCENVQGTKLGYCQSDEISLLLVDYDNLDTQAWFEYRVQKMCAVGASMATLAFNKFFDKNINMLNIVSTVQKYGSNKQYTKDYLEQKNLITTYFNAQVKGAMFDCRCFNIPKEEVTNYFYWRQQDCIRNSVQMVGQDNFSHNELQHKSQKDIKEMLVKERNINWDELQTNKKRGSCCVKEKYFVEDKGTRNHWIVDNNIPTFKGDGREYIEKLI